jgi:integrase
MELCLTIDDNHYDPHRIQAPVTGYFYYQDSVIPYLRLRVSSAGSRCWFFDKSLEGKHVKRKIGEATLTGLPEARMRAVEMAKDLSDGIVPATHKQRIIKHVAGRLTVSDCFKRYFDEYAAIQCSSAAEMMRGFKAYWTQIGIMYVSELTPVMVQDWVNKLAKEKGKATANKQFNTLRACVNWAIEQNVIELKSSPFKSVRSFKLEHQINYLKLGDETKRLLDQLENESEDIRDAIQLLLFTGQRKRNVISMEWSEIDMRSGTWTVPPHKTKSRKQYSIALTGRSLEILRRRFESASSPRVFNRVSIDTAWRKCRDKAGLPNLNIHHLRHTTATWLAQSGASAAIIQRAMNHASLATSAKYIHLEPADVKSALELAQSKVN